MILKRNKIGVADIIIRLTVKITKNNILRKKQTTKKVLSNLFKGFEVRRKVRLMFWTKKNSMKGKCYIFSGYKQRNKVCPEYLECKLQQESYCWCIFKLKCDKTVDRTLLETRKQQTRYRWCFQLLKCLRECNNCFWTLSRNEQDTVVCI